MGCSEGKPANAGGAHAPVHRAAPPAGRPAKLPPDNSESPTKAQPRSPTQDVSPKGADDGDGGGDGEKKKDPLLESTGGPVLRRDMKPIDPNARRKSIAPKRLSLAPDGSEAPSEGTAASASGASHATLDSQDNNQDSPHALDLTSSAVPSPAAASGGSAVSAPSASEQAAVNPALFQTSAPVVAPSGHPEYDAAHLAFDMVDGEGYDSAFTALMNLVKTRVDGALRINLVALMGVSALHGLGGDSWARVAPASVADASDDEKMAAEVWLRTRHLAKMGTPTHGSPAALLALSELYRVLNKDPEEENFVLQCLALKPAHPLALLRHSIDTLAALKKERGKDMDTAKLKEMEIEKRILLRNFNILSEPNTRVGAKAGKYVWMSHYKVHQSIQQQIAPPPYTPHTHLHRALTAWTATCPVPN